MNFQKLICLILFIFLTPVISAQAEDSSVGNTDLKYKLSYKMGIDLEQLPENGGYSEESSDAFWAQLRLRIDGNIATDWSFHTDFRGFASTSSISERLSDDTGRTESTSDDDAFLQLRRLWIRYDGLTNYPGENLTLGLQRVRSHSTLLWDGDIESLVWRFSTTQLDFQTGIGEQFDSYRTNTDLSSVDQDKPRLFTELSYDWLAYHEITLSAMYAEQNSVTDSTTIYEGAPDGINGKWLWYGAALSSNWNKRRHQSQFAYNLQWLGLQGKSDFLTTDGSDVYDCDISAWAVDAGIRYDMTNLPLSFGFSYAQGSGGFDKDESNMYVQTGLDSNRSAYIGNELYFYRFNEALDPDLTNLRQYALFSSGTIAENFLLGFAISKFERSDDTVPIYKNTNPLDLQDGSDDIGWGVDLVFRHKINTKILHFPISYYGLRNSVFLPGDSFSDDDDATVYAFLFEIAGDF